jgi:hypothetical protein
MNGGKTRNCGLQEVDQSNHSRGNRTAKAGLGRALVLVGVADAGIKAEDKIRPPS